MFEIVVEKAVVRFVLDLWRCPLWLAASVDEKWPRGNAAAVKWQ
jgi:hypothetical protein